jgi:hypothetical protein
MNPTNAINLALAALQAVLGIIAEIKGQSGVTDAQILAQAQTLTAGNDAAYAQLKAALTGTTPAA